MKIENDKIEFDMNEFAPLLLQDKQEGFRRIGEMFLNAVLEKAPRAFPTGSLLPSLEQRRTKGIITAQITGMGPKRDD